MVQTPLQTLSDAQEWDLSDLYQGFDDPKLEEDLQELDRRAQAFRSQYRGQLAHCSPSEVAIALQDLEAIHQKSGYLYAFPSLKFSADTRDSQAQQFEDKVMEALTQIENQLLFFELELQALDESQFAQLQEAEALSNYHHYLQRIAEFRPHCLPEAVEQTRNQDVLTGREAFIYQTNSCKVNWSHANHDLRIQVTTHSRTDDCDRAHARCLSFGLELCASSA